MRKVLKKIRVFAFLAVSVAFLISFICLYNKNTNVNAVEEKAFLTVWQIDSFEGGKGSRADYLQNIGNALGKEENCYINVISVSSEAARLNLANGNVPDMISYGAGIHGIESYVIDHIVWCQGCYCLLTLDSNSDFTDINSENTVVNKGKDNYTEVVALFEGLQGAKSESPTSAYVKLINGEYKYLLGTQRDIFRLKTRNVTFSVKPVTVFNDLYQNISRTTNCSSNIYAQKYIDKILSSSRDIGKIGMFVEGQNLYDDEMSVCENINYEYKLIYPINEAMKLNFEKCITLNDINMLKDLLK